MQPRLASTTSLAFLLAIVAFLVQTTSARAGHDPRGRGRTVTAGSSNDSFDVVLQNTGPSAVTVAGFSFGLTSSSNVTFTDVTTATAMTYIFNGNSLFGPDIVLSAGAGRRLGGGQLRDAQCGFYRGREFDRGPRARALQCRPGCFGSDPGEHPGVPGYRHQRPERKPTSRSRPSSPARSRSRPRPVPEPSSLVLTTTGLLECWASSSSDAGHPPPMARHEPGRPWRS